MDSLQILISAVLADPTLKDIKTQLDVIKKEYGNLTINLNIDKQAIAALTTIADTINKATKASVEQAKATNTVTEAIKNEKKATDEATAAQVKYNVAKKQIKTAEDGSTTISNTNGSKFNNTKVSQTTNSDGSIIDHPIIQNIDTAGQVRAQAAEQLAIDKKASEEKLALEKEYQSYLKADLDAQKTANNLYDSALIEDKKRTIAAKKVSDKEYTQFWSTELNLQEKSQQELDNALIDTEKKRLETVRLMNAEQQAAEYKAKVDNYEASLKQELSLQKEYNSSIKADLDAQEAANSLYDAAILEDKKRTIAAKKVADSEYSSWWKTNLAEMENLDKAHYLALQADQKMSLAAMKKQQDLADKEQIAQQEAEQKAQAAQMQKGSARQSITGAGGLSVANMALSIGLFTTLNSLYQTMVQGMKDVEDGAAGLQQVFEKQITSTTQLNKVTDEFIGIAQKYGTSVNDVLAGAKQWGRQYKDVETAMTLTNSSTLLSIVDNVALADSNRGLEATMNSLGMAAKTQTEAFANSMKIVDSWSALAHQASVSATDLVHATENSAGAAKAAGVSFDQLQALATAGVRNTGLQGANVGNMLKSVFASINSDKAEKALDSVGIKLKQVGANGKEEFRPVFDVLLQLSQYLQTSDKNNQKLLETISGGKYQWSKVSSLLSDYNTILDANAISVNSAGKAAEYAQVQMNTLSRDVTRLKDTFIEIAAQTDQNGLGSFLKTIVDGLTSLILGLEKLPAGFDLAIVGIGGLLIAFKALNSVMTTLEPLAKILIVSYQGMAAKQVEATVATEAQTVATEAQTVAMEGEVLASTEVIATTEATIVALEGETVAATEATAAFTTLDIVSGGLALVIGLVVTAFVMTAVASGRASTATLAHNEAIKEQVGLNKQALDVANQKMAFMDTAIKQEAQLKKALEDTNLTHEQRAKLMKDQIDLYHAVGTATDNDKLKNVDASNVKNQSLADERVAISKLVTAKKTAYEDAVKTNSKIVQDDLDATNKKIDHINVVIEGLKKETLAKMSEMTFGEKASFDFMKVIGFTDTITGNFGAAKSADELATEVKKNARDKALADANKKYDDLKAQKAKDEYTIAGGNLDLANIDISNDSPNGVPDPLATSASSTAAIDAKADGIQKLDLTNQQIKAIQQQREATVDLNTQLDKKIAASEKEKNYQQAIDYTNQLLTNQKKLLTEIDTANNSIHGKAEDLRKGMSSDPRNQFGLTSSDLNSWFDSKGQASSSYDAIQNKIKQQSADVQNGNMGDAAKKKQLDYLSEEQKYVTDLFNSLSKLQEAYRSNGDEAQKVTDALSTGQSKIVDDTIKSQDASLVPFTDNIKRLKTAMSSLKTDPSAKIADQNELIQAYIDESAKIEEANKKLEALNATLVVNSDAWNTNKDKMVANKATLEQLSADQESERMKIATQAIDTIKKGIQTEIDAEKSLHDAKIKNIDDATNAAIAAIDKIQQANDYNKNLEKDQTDAQKLQNEINAFSLDSSNEGRSKVIDLKQQQATLKEKIDDEQTKRSNEIVKQSLQDQNKATKDSLDDQSKIKTDALQNQLNDDTHWLDLQTQLMNGHVDGIQTEMKSLIDKLGTYAKDSLGVAETQISKIKTMMSNLGGSSTQVGNLPPINSNPASSGGSGTGSGGTVSGFYIPKDQNETDTITTMKKYAANWANATTVAEKKQWADLNQNWGKQIGASYDSGTGKWSKDNLPLFESGGRFTGSFNGVKLAGLHEKELVLDKFDTSNILKVVDFTRDIMSKIKIPDLSNFTPKMAGGGGNNFNLNLGGVNITGDRAGGETALGVIVNGLKRMGVNINQ